MIMKGLVEGCEVIGVRRWEREDAVPRSEVSLTRERCFCTKAQSIVLPVVGLQSEGS